MTISTSKPKLYSTLGQVCKLIPTHLVAKLARETGAFILSYLFLKDYGRLLFILFWRASARV